MNTNNINNNYITKHEISQISKKKFTPSKTRGKSVYNPMSNVYSAMRNLEDIIIYNFSPNMKFITLTVEDKYNSLDVDWWKREVYLFIRRLYYWFKKQKRYAKMPKLNYVWVYEPHKTKPSYHIHMIVDCPYIPHQKDNNVLQKLWGKGITYITSLSNAKAFVKSMSSLDNRSDNLANIKSSIQIIKYISKYMVKNFKTKLEHPELKGKQLYFVSDGWGKNAIKKETKELSREETFKLRKKCMTKGFLVNICKQFDVSFEIKVFDVKKLYKCSILKFLVPTQNKDKFFEKLYAG